MVGCINYKGRMRSPSLGTPIMVKQHEDYLCQFWADLQFSLSEPKSPLGQKALAHDWLIGLLYAFPLSAHVAQDTKVQTAVDSNFGAHKLISAFFKGAWSLSWNPAWDLSHMFESLKDSFSTNWLWRVLWKGYHWKWPFCWQLPQQEVLENCMPWW